MTGFYSRCAAAASAASGPIDGVLAHASAADTELSGSVIAGAPVQRPVPPSSFTDVIFGPAVLVLMTVRSRSTALGRRSVPRASLGLLNEIDKCAKRRWQVAAAGVVKERSREAVPPRF